jgi:hypothetical protein
MVLACRRAAELSRGWDRIYSVVAR